MFGKRNEAGENVLLQRKYVVYPGRFLFLEFDPQGMDACVRAHLRNLSFRTHPSRNVLSELKISLFIASVLAWLQMHLPHMASF